MGKQSTLLIRAGFSPVLAEELSGTLERFSDADLGDALSWSKNELGRLPPETLEREARIGWWESDGVAFEFKRLLDAADAGGKLIVQKAFVVPDERHVVLEENGVRLLNLAVARAWAEAYARWERAPFNPDVPPELPALGSLKALVDFHTHFAPSGFDPSHPAHALRLYLEAVKAWSAGDHPRYPTGTPVDPETGAGGGRFIPKEGGETEKEKGKTSATAQAASSGAPKRRSGPRATVEPGTRDYSGYEGGEAAVIQEQLRVSLAFHGIEDPDGLILSQLKGMTPEEREAWFAEQPQRDPLWDGKEGKEDEEGEKSKGKGKGKGGSDKPAGEESKKRSDDSNPPPRPPCAAGMARPELIGSVGGINLYADVVDVMSGNLGGTAYTHDTATGELSGCTPLSDLLSTEQWAGLDIEGATAEAGKAWVADNHPRHPAGTRIDPQTGAGGGRFAPKLSSGEISPKQVAGIFDLRVDDPVQRAIDRDASYLAALRNEEMIVYDEQGNILFQAAGERDFVAYTEEQARTMRGKTLLHNHPSGMPFSHTDYITALTTRLSTLAVVSGDYIYRLDLPPEFYENVATYTGGGDWLTNPVMDDWDAMRLWLDAQLGPDEAAVRGVLEPLVQSGAISAEEANATHFDLLFAKEQAFFARYGGKLMRLERHEGFFVEGGAEEQEALDATRSLARYDARLQAGFTPGKLRSESAVLVDSGGKERPVANGFIGIEPAQLDGDVLTAGAALVYKATFAPSPYAGNPATGAPLLSALNNALNAGVEQFYFGGISHAYRLRVRQPQALKGESGAALLREFDEIVAGINKNRLDNEAAARRANSAANLHTLHEDVLASAALANHQAFIELARRHADVFAYNGLYYGAHNAKLIEPTSDNLAQRIAEVIG